MKASINKSTLKASIHCAAKNDTRYYLNGVCLSFIHGEYPRIEIVSTDGHIISAFSDTLIYSEGEQTSDYQIIVPLDVVKNAIKGCKHDTVILQSLDDGYYLLGDIRFLPIDAKFPEYRRVLPTCNSKPSAAQCNPELLMRGQAAIRDYYTDKKMVVTQTHLNNGVVMHDGKNDAIVYVMGHRTANLTFQGFIL